MQFRCRCGKELFVPTAVRSAQMRCPACGEVFDNPNSTQRTAPSNSSSRQSGHRGRPGDASRTHATIPARGESFWNSPSKPGSAAASAISTRTMLILMAIPFGVLAFGIVGFLAYWGLSRFGLELDSLSLSKESNRPKLPAFDESMTQIRNVGLATSLQELESQYRSRAGNDQSAKWLEILTSAGQLDLNTGNLIRMNPACGRIEEAITPAHGLSLTRVSDRHRELIERVDQVTQSPFIVFYPLTDDPIQSSKFREIRDAEKVARLMFLDAYHQAFQGQVSTAVRRLLSGLRIASTVEQYPNDLVTILHYSMISNAKGALVHLLQSNRLDEFQLVSLDHEFRKVLHTDSSRACLSGNLVVGLKGYQAPEATLKYMLDVSVEKVWDEKSALADVKRNHEYDRNYFVDRIFSRFKAINDRGLQRQLISSEKKDSTDAQLVRLGTLLLSPLDVTSSLRWATWHEAETARTSIALERFRRAQQTIPATLQQLVPQYLDSVPLDYFSNSPMGYLPQQNNYSLFSMAESEIQSSSSINNITKVWLRTTVYMESLNRLDTPSQHAQSLIPGSGADQLVKEAERNMLESAERSLQMQREHESKKQTR